MSNEQNIPQDKNENVKEHFPEDSHAPQTSNTEPQTTDMEVHKHPLHVTHKKKWTEYLLEFLMLFLAVFLGFLAENIREHQVEKDKARQYTLSFYEDLKNDTTRMNNLIQYDKEKIAALKTMYSCYDTVSKNLKATACMGVLTNHSRSNKGFVLTDRTLRQLANAGGYRMLSKEDADSIIAYENLYKSYLDFQTTVFQASQDNVRNTLNQLADFRIIAPHQLTTANFAADTASTDLAGPLLFTEDRVLLNKWFNELAMYLRTTNGQHNIILQLKNKAIALIEYYKEKHGFE
jgi:hypothetical protein